MPIIEPEFMDLTRDLDTEAFWEENTRTNRTAPSISRRTIIGSLDS
jgi:hypothetical protein